MTSRTDPAWRWEHRRSGLYASAADQLDPAEFEEYVAALAAALGDLDPHRAAWHARDVVLSAGEQGGAEPHLDLLRALRELAGGPSWHGRPRALPPAWTRVVYRGGLEPVAPSWTSSQRVAVSYAGSDRRGRQRPATAPVWRLEATPGDVLAVVPVARAGGPDEYVLDPAGITVDRLVEVPEEELPRPLPRRGGRILWQAAR